MRTLEIQISTDLTHFPVKKVLGELLDKHAPRVKKKTRRSASQPCFGPEILAARCVKRANERAWKKSGLNVHRQAFCDNSTIYYNTIRRKKCEYYQETFSAADSKQMFEIVNKLTTITKSILPEHENEEDLATSMANYSSEKICQLEMF